MKGIYKAFIFLMIFQLTAVMIGVLGIFPYSFYSDLDFEGFPDVSSNWTEYLVYFFGGTTTNFAETLTIFSAISGLLLIAGIIALKNGTIAPFMLAVMASVSIHMLNTSREFLGKLFETGGIGVVYLGICLTIPICAMLIFSIVEHQTGGDSG